MGQSLRLHLFFCIAEQILHDGIQHYPLVPSAYGVELKI